MSWIAELFGAKRRPKSADPAQDEYWRQRIEAEQIWQQANELAHLIWHCKAAPAGMGRTPSLGMMEVVHRGAIIARVKMATTPLGSRKFDLCLPAPGSDGVAPLLDVFRHHAAREQAEAEALRQKQIEEAAPRIIDACKAYWEAQG
jgi:hypothetical protein